MARLRPCRFVVAIGSRAAVRLFSTLCSTMSSQPSKSRRSGDTHRCMLQQRMRGASRSLFALRSHSLLRFSSRLRALRHSLQVVLLFVCL